MNIQAKSLQKIEAPEIKRIKTHINGFDALTNGGLVPGTAIIFAGEKGAGKSTFLMQIASKISAENPVLYISAEENLAQLKTRAERLGATSPLIYCSENNAVEDIEALIKKIKPSVVIIDSIKFIYTKQSKAVIGGPTQTVRSLDILIKIAREKNIALIAINHLTKEGTMAGLETLQHMADILMLMTISEDKSRMIQVDKNRYGEAQAYLNLNMTNKGFSEIGNVIDILHADKQQAKEIEQQAHEEIISYEEILARFVKGSTFRSLIYQFVERWILRQFFYDESLGKIKRIDLKISLTE